MSLLPESFDKYVRFFRFILKYWNSDIFSDSEEDFEVLDIEEDPNWEHSPEELVEDLKQMGPTYVKLGQLLSTRPDMLPQPYLDEIGRASCRERVYIV